MENRGYITITGLENKDEQPIVSVKIEISGEKEALPVGFSGKARYLQVSMHVSYKK